ncbi:MAG: dynamin family protein [Deltaproteobacteria bacterium]|jgi:GTPase Era involved in 16S rRNA processing|nr:dynamin family protein [Deltaproteobacteria bacterium]
MINTSSINSIVSETIILCDEFLDIGKKISECYEPVQLSNLNLNLYGASFISKLINNEIHLLKNSEIIFAVVGTMKAGKTTLINAIAGCHIMPVRNMPMTVIPTLVKHTLGNNEAVLKSINVELVDNLKKSIVNLYKSGDYKKIFNSFFFEKDNLFIDKILKFPAIKPIYNGTNEICSFLTFYNDLVRIGILLNINFPFKMFTDIAEIPRIEVEFQNFKVNSDNWKLTLLDIPGPNEAGFNTDLSELMNDLIKKASRILYVINYTEINSLADHAVREAVTNYAPDISDRLRILVNHFDQKDNNSLSKEGLINFFKNKFKLSNGKNISIFPVSAKYAYLAKRALNEIEVKGSLDPDEEGNDWVKDFAKTSFGVDWIYEIKDSSRILKTANRMWEKSGFPEFLNEITNASGNMALIALQSTFSKLHHYSLALTSKSKKTLTFNKQLEFYNKYFPKLVLQSDKIQTFVKSKMNSYASHIYEALSQLKRDILNDFKEFIYHGEISHNKTSKYRLETYRTEIKSSSLRDFPFTRVNSSLEESAPENDVSPALRLHLTFETESVIRCFTKNSDINPLINNFIFTLLEITRVSIFNFFHKFSDDLFILLDESSLLLEQVLQDIDESTFRLSKERNDIQKSIIKFLISAKNFPYFFNNFTAIDLNDFRSSIIKRLKSIKSGKILKIGDAIITEFLMRFNDDFKDFKLSFYPMFVFLYSPTPFSKNISSALNSISQDLSNIIATFGVLAKRPALNRPLNKKHLGKISEFQRKIRYIEKIALKTASG